LNIHYISSQFTALRPCFRLPVDPLRASNGRYLGVFLMSFLE
jgi:hypothetical protein